MKSFHFICLVCFYTVGVSTLPAQSEKTREADRFLALASVELSDGNTLATLELSTDALSLSREINYSKGKAISCFYIGRVLVQMGNYEKSLEYLALCEQEKYTSRDFALRSELCRIKGEVYQYLSLKKASIREFQKAYALASPVGDKDEKLRLAGEAYIHLGVAYNKLNGNPDSLLYYLNMGEKLLEKTDEARTYKNKINLYTILGNHYMNLQQLDVAEFYFDKAQSLILKYHYSHASLLYAYRGDLQKRKNDAASALYYYRKGLENAKRANLQNELPGLYKKMSDLFFQTGVEDSARFYGEQYILISTKLSESRNEATEKALQILLEEEQQNMQSKQLKILLSLGVFFILFFSVRNLIWSRWKRRKMEIMDVNERKISELKHKLDTAYEEVVEMARTNDPAFATRFREVYPEFCRTLLRRHPHIFHSEFQLCAMIFLHFSSKEIAEYMFITHRSAQTKKSRLRKRLGISGNTDIYRYLISLSFSSEFC